MLFCVKDREFELDDYKEQLELVYDWFYNHDMKALVNEEILFVDGDRVKIILQEYDTSPIEERGWETHDKYFDVMYIEEGEEIIGIAQRDRLGPVKVPYDEANDIAWYESANAPTWVHLVKGDVMIISPDEGHNSRICVDKPSFVRKYVAKVHI